MSRDENIENDVAEFIAESVFNNLSANIRECIRIARLTDNNITKARRVVKMLTTYGNRRVKLYGYDKILTAFTLILKYYYIRYWSGSSFSFPYVCIGSTAFEFRSDFLINCDDIEPEITISINRLISLAPTLLPSH